MWLYHNINLFSKIVLIYIIYTYYMYCIKVRKCGHHLSWHKTNYEDFTSKLPEQTDGIVKRKEAVKQAK